MRTGKTIVINGKSLLRKSIGLLTAAGIFVSFSFGIPLCYRHGILTPDSMLRDILPAAGISAMGTTDFLASFKLRCQKAGRLLLYSDIIPRGFLLAEIPALSAVGVITPPAPGTPPPQPEAAPPPDFPAEIPEEYRAPIKTVSACPNKNGDKTLRFGNETSYGIDANELLSEAPQFSYLSKAPKVLVIHTHATEAYAPQGSTVYDTRSSERSTDKSQNVVQIGNVFCDALNRKGIVTLHDIDLHDHPSFNGAYAHSLAAVEEYLQKYPTIEAVFDLHRDSIVYSDSTKAKLATEIDGKTAAQLMFVVGTDEKGLTHPDWEENLCFAAHLQKAINDRYPTLMRHINLRKERFNGHTTHGSVIIEVGSSGNSLNEAEYGITLAAECIADYLLLLK